MEIIVHGFYSRARACAFAERDEMSDKCLYYNTVVVCIYTGDARDRAGCVTPMPPRKVKTGQEDPRHKKVNTAYVAACWECRQERATFKW